MMQYQARYPGRTRTRQTPIWAHQYINNKNGNSTGKVFPNFWLACVGNFL